MKEKIIIALCLLMLIMQTLCLTIILKETQYNKYDVNKDGKVSAFDYVEIRKYIMEEEKNFHPYDVNRDGIVDAVDYVKVYKYIMEEKWKRK